jgi:hypothetical protein
MSQDPNQPPSSQNEYPYGEPADPARGTPDVNPYDNAQNPYGASQYPYGEPQSASPYEAPQNASPYGEPQSASPYEAPAGYGTIAPDSNFNYGGGMPEGSPLPLGEAIRQLPGQYKRVLTRPSAMIFAFERGKASWDIIWVQLMGSAIIAALLGLLGVLINPYRFAGLGNSHLSSPMSQAISVGTSIGLILLVPLSFFISVGILQLTAKAFKGQGTFLQYAYSIVLIMVPLGIIGGVLGLIPFVGTILSLAISIYELVLYVFATMGVHRLSGGKATAVVLLPALIVFVVVCVVAFVAVFLIAGAMHSGRAY